MEGNDGSGHQAEGGVPLCNAAVQIDNTAVFWEERIERS